MYHYKLLTHLAKLRIGMLPMEMTDAVFQKRYASASLTISCRADRLNSWGVGRGMALVAI